MGQDPSLGSVLIPKHGMRRMAGRHQAPMDHISEVNRADIKGQRDLPCCFSALIPEDLGPTLVAVEKVERTPTIEFSWHSGRLASQRKL